jgi:uncharacterized protein DUF3540
MHATRIAIPPEPAAPAVELAQVIAAEGRRCRVRSASGGEVDARVAASCLVQPCAGDQVALLAAAGAEVPYVWAVLERAEGGPLGISAPEGLSVSAPAGAIVLSAERIEVLSRQRVGITAPDVEVEARGLRLSFRELSATGTQAALSIDVLRFLGKNVTLLLERVLTRVRRSYRVVEELEQMSGRQLDYKLSENFSVRGKNNLITAEELVKLDGKQLHLG